MPQTNFFINNIKEFKIISGITNIYLYHFFVRKTRYFNHPNDILYTFHDKQPLSETGETLRIHLIEEIMKIMAIRRYNGESNRRNNGGRDKAAWKGFPKGLGYYAGHGDGD